MEQMVTIRDIDVESMFAKSNLPVCDYSVNPYAGCTHACKYRPRSNKTRTVKHHICERIIFVLD